MHEILNRYSDHELSNTGNFRGDIEDIVGVIYANDRARFVEKIKILERPKEVKAQKNFDCSLNHRSLNFLLHQYPTHLHIIIETNSISIELAKS